jgi:hypothetical protein
LKNQLDPCADSLPTPHFLSLRGTGSKSLFVLSRISSHSTWPEPEPANAPSRISLCERRSRLLNAQRKVGRRDAQHVGPQVCRQGTKASPSWRSKPHDKTTRAQERSSNKATSRPKNQSHKGPDEGVDSVREGRGTRARARPASGAFVPTPRGAIQRVHGCMRVC